MPACAMTLLHHEGALGDVLLSLPCFSLLKQEHPVLHFVGRRDVGTLLRDAGVVAEVSSSDNASYASLYAGEAGPEARSVLQRFSRAWVFTVHPDSAFVAALRMVVPDTRTVVTVPPAGTPVHAAAFRLAQLGGSADPSGQLLVIPPRYGERAAAMLARAGYDGCRPLIAVHPGSGGSAKCWPLENYLALIERLQDKGGAFVVILTGPAENESFKARIDIFTRGRSGVLHVADVALTTVAALLGRCDLFIGNDSGIGHLAAVLGSSVLVLFGPTNPALWKPIGPQVTVIHAALLAELPMDEVYARVPRIS